MFPFLFNVTQSVMNVATFRLLTSELNRFSLLAYDVTSSRGEIPWHSTLPNSAHVACVNKIRVTVNYDGYHVVITSSIPMKRIMCGRERGRGKYSGGGTITACGGGRSMGSVSVASVEC
jgi:hypothetical protein